MTVAETSRDAYQELKKSGQDVTDRERCLTIIEEYGPITMEEMEPSMGKTKSAFSGRIRELKDEGLVEVTGTRDGHQLLDTVENSDVEKVDERGDEFVSISEADSLEDESVEGLFVDDKQSEVSNESTQNKEKVCNDNEQKPKAGDVIYG